MSSLRFWVLLFVVSVATLEGAFGLRLSVPSTPTFVNRSVNLTWISGPGDPAAFNIDALCNNITVPLRAGVLGKGASISLPLSQLPKAVLFPYASCIIKATNTSNNATLASTSSFIVLSTDLTPTSPLPTTPTTIGSLTTSSFETQSSFISDASSSTVFSQSSVTSISRSTDSDALILTTISGQLTAVIQQLTTQATTIAETTDSLGNVLTTPEASINTFSGAFTPGTGRFTEVRRTRTLTFVAHSSTSILTLTYTTDIPIQSSTSPGGVPEPLTRNQVASIVGGTVGCVAVMALLLYICLIRRRRQHTANAPAILEPLICDPAYRQPPEKSARLAEEAGAGVLPRSTNSSSMQLQLNLDVGDSLRPVSMVALAQDALIARELRVQMQRMSERLSELEDQHRLETFSDRWIHAAQEIRPPEYADTESYSYSERIVHG